MGLKLTCREAVFLLEAPGEDLFPAPRRPLHASAQVPFTLTSAFMVTSPLTLTRCPLIRTLVMTLGHQDDPRSHPHLKILNLITPANHTSLCHADSQGMGIRMWTFWGCPFILPTTPGSLLSTSCNMALAGHQGAGHPVQEAENCQLYLWPSDRNVN